MRGLSKSKCLLKYSEENIPCLVNINWFHNDERPLLPATNQIVLGKITQVN